MMTEEQKSRIAELRGQGVPFSKIAKQLDLNRDTIKSYCRRYGIGVDADNADKNIPQCKNCGAKIVQPPKKKKKIFCCDKCRNAWWAAHPDKIHKKAAKKSLKLTEMRIGNTAHGSVIWRRGLVRNNLPISVDITVLFMVKLYQINSEERKYDFIRIKQRLLFSRQCS